MNGFIRQFISNINQQYIHWLFYRLLIRVESFILRISSFVNHSPALSSGMSLYFGISTTETSGPNVTFDGCDNSPCGASLASSSRKDGRKSIVLKTSKDNVLETAMNSSLEESDPLSSEIVMDVLELRLALPNLTRLPQLLTVLILPMHFSASDFLLLAFLTSMMSS